MSNEQLVREIVLRARDEASHTVTKFDSVLSSMGLNVKNLERQFLSLPSAIGIGLSVGSVVAFGKSIIDLAGHIDDISKQTGASGQFLSGVKSTLEENGTSVDAFAKGIFNLQKNLGNVDDDSDKVALAIQRLGLNLNQLRNAGTDDFIKLVTDALAKIQNPVERNTVLFNLLGKSAKELGPALNAMTGQFDKLKNEGMSDEQIAQLDKFGDALTKLGNKAMIMAAGPLSRLAAAFAELTGTRTTGEILAGDLDRIDKQMTGIVERLARLAEATDPIFEKQRSIMQAQLAALGQQRAEIDKNLKALGEPAKGPGKFEPPPSKTGEAAQTRAAEAAARFGDSIEKQITALRAQAIALVQGEQAAKTWALEQEFAEIKANLLRQMLEQKIPNAVGIVNRAFASIDVKKLSADLAEAQKETAQLQAVMENSVVAKLFKEQIEEDAASLKALKDAEEAVKNAVLERKKAQEIGFERVLTQDSEEWLRAIEDSNKAFLEGRSAEEGYTKGLHEIDRIAVALGSSFDITGAKIAAARAELERLARGNTLGQFNDQIEQTQEELRTLELDKSVQELAHGLSQSISQGIGQTVQGIAQGTQTLEQGLKNMLQNVVLNISQWILKETVMKPLEKALETVFKDIFMALGVGGQAGGAGQGGGIFDQILSSLKIDFSSMFSDLSSWFTSLFSSIFSFFAAEGAILPGQFVPIHAFARGGVTTGPTLGFIGEGDRPEAVVPLPDGRSIPVRNIGGADARRPQIVLHLHQTFDYSGTIDPRGMKTTQKEVRQYVVDDLRNRNEIRDQMKRGGRR